MNKKRDIIFYFLCLSFAHFVSASEIVITQPERVTGLESVYKNVHQPFPPDKCLNCLKKTDHYCIGPLFAVGGTIILTGSILSAVSCSKYACCILGGFFAGAGSIKTYLDGKEWCSKSSNTTLDESNDNLEQLG